MKKLIFLCILLFCSTAYAGNLMMIGGGVPVVAGDSCAVVTGAPSVTAEDDQLTINTYYVGMKTYVPTSNETVCQLDFNLQGLGTATSCTARIFNGTGTDLRDIGTEVAHSNAVAVATGWNNFPLTSDASLVTTGTYHLVMECGNVNLGYVPYINNYDSAAPFPITTWNADEEFVGTYANYEINIKLYRK